MRSATSPSAIELWISTPLYDNIFLPAIGEVHLPEGGKLEPRRTDRTSSPGDIKLEMFQYPRIFALLCSPRSA